MMNAWKKLIEHQPDVGEHGDDMREIHDRKESDSDDRQPIGWKTGGAVDARQHPEAGDGLLRRAA